VFILVFLFLDLEEAGCLAWFGLNFHLCLTPLLFLQARSLCGNGEGNVPTIGRRCQAF
jgi:hypothetical protein